ncbi:hypothetical protein [Ralstonia pseudosolanacearum]
MLSDDYEKLKIFFVCYVDWFIPPEQKSERPEDQPVKFLENIERKSISNAKKGLQMAVNDVIEMTADWSPQQVNEADERFSSHGTFTLSEVRRRYSKTYLQIVRRGSIKSEVEYYLLKGVVDNGEINLDSEEGRKLILMLSEYEEATPRK